jgi:hypothetical protein
MFVKANSMLRTLDMMFGQPYIVSMIEHSAVNRDDAPTMTIGERTTWLYGALVLLTAAGYFAVVLPQLAHTPVARIAWQLPMLIAIGATVAGTIVGTVIATIAAAIITRDPEQASDIRDRQIDRHGDRASLAVMGVGLALALVLAMLELDAFWIGSGLFAIGAASALWSTVAKIRAYRRSFHG